MALNPNSPLPGVCPACSQSFDSLKECFKVPVFDPSEAPNPMDASKLIGKYFHADCWVSHEYFSLVSSLVITTLSSEFIAPEEKVFCEGNVALWCKTGESPDFQNGVLYLSRSSFLFQNIMGGDVEGSIIRGHKEELNALTSFIFCEEFDVGYFKLHGSLRLECLEKISGGFLIKVDSDSDDFKGYLCLSIRDKTALSLAVVV